MPPRIQLVGSSFTRAFRNVWMLEELGLSYEVIDVAPGSRFLRSLVESGKIPILLEFDDDVNKTVTNNATSEQQPSFILYESSAINTHLADQYEESSRASQRFVPEPKTRERAIYDQTISCVMTELDAQGLWIHRKHAAMGQYFGTIPDAVDAAKLNFTKMNQQISKQLNPYLLGEKFTAADILYVHCLDWSKSIGWHVDWPSNVQPYRDLCHTRPAYLSAKAKRDVGKEERKQNGTKLFRKEDSTSNL